jgi:hypothetical protein
MYTKKCRFFRPRRALLKVCCCIQRLSRGLRAVPGAYSMLVSWKKTNNPNRPTPLEGGKKPLSWGRDTHGLQHFQRFLPNGRKMTSKWHEGDYEGGKERKGAKGQTTRIGRGTQNRLRTQPIPLADQCEELRADGEGCRESSLPACLVP